MKQYLYYHTGREYVPRYSVTRSDSGYSDIVKLFETLRKNVEGNTFTYGVTSGGEAVFMQASRPDSSGQFVKGLRGEMSSVTEVPARYIDLFEKSSSEIDDDAETLPEADLPPLGRMTDDSDYKPAEHCHHIFPKLIDALLYGDQDKKIIILAKNHEDAVRYIKVLSYILPAAYIKRVGFSLGVSKIPNEIKIVKNNGTEEKLSIRVWLPDTAAFRFNYEALAERYYVFDVTNGDKEATRDNYTAELHFASKLLDCDCYSLADRSRVEDFLRDVGGAFDPYGKVDLTKLNSDAASAYFALNPDVDSAKQIIEMGCGGLEGAFTEAARLLLKPENSGAISPQYKSAIGSAYKSYDSVKTSLDDDLFGFYCSSYASLSPEEKRTLADMVCGDLSGARMEHVLNNAFVYDLMGRAEAFSYAAEILKTALAKNRNMIKAIKGIVKAVVQFFRVENYFSILSVEWRNSGEELFDTALNYGDKMRQLIAAVLMASAYQKSSVGEIVIRVKGFKRLLPNAADGNLGKLIFILDVKNKIKEISDALPELDIETDNLNNFLFNVPAGKTLASELVRSFTFDEALEADIRLRSPGYDDYASMRDIVVARLLDENFVRENVMAGSVTLTKYREFFESLPDTERATHDAIDQLINDADHEEKCDDKFARYRYDFTCQCYKTLSKENKRQIQPDGSDDLKTYGEIPEMQEKTRIVESTIQVFGVNKIYKRKGTLSYHGVFLWAFGFSLLAFIILNLPSVIVPLSLGTLTPAGIFDKFVYYFKPYTVILPVYVFALELVVYGIFKEGKRLKRANIATALCGVLPVVLFTAAFVLCYFFVRIDLPFGL